MNNQKPITEVIKQVLPAVVSITISKFLPVFDSPYGPFVAPPGMGPMPPGMGQMPKGRMPARPSQGGPAPGFPFHGMEQFFVAPKGKKKMKVGGGSGFIVDSSGIILTNRHVVEDPNAEYVVVLTDEKKYPAKVIARDPINDIAVLKIKASNLPTLELGDSSTLELGQTAFAIGNALGAFRNTVSSGVVSGLSREITAGDMATGQVNQLRGLIQTDAAVNPGNSGGPLIDDMGRVIGINAAMVLLAENIGFALPVNAAKKDLEELKKYGRIRQAFLGLRYLMLNPELQQRHNFPAKQGALVVSQPSPEGISPAVLPGGPADKAGIKEADIILSVGKEKVSMKNPLRDILQKFEIDTEIDLKVLRQGKELALKLILAEKF